LQQILSINDIYPQNTKLFFTQPNIYTYDCLKYSIVMMVGLVKSIFFYLRKKPQNLRV